ncbi:hypothetical protein CC2G_014304 [Coprinopsis cinerea AmutBmut pab1-1]|nr:hypothetical protein CC2G_014304 [Coprinopsis cinerea AmutBmut pab1-1]
MTTNDSTQTNQQTGLKTRSHSRELNGDREHSETRPLEPNPDEREQSIPVGSLRPEATVGKIQEASMGVGKISRGCAISTNLRTLELDQRPDDERLSHSLETYIKRLDQSRRPTSELHSAFTYQPISDGPGHAPFDRVTKRDADEANLVGEESSDYEESAHGLRESDMPWYQKEEEVRTRARRGCVSSTNLIRTFARNPSRVTRWIATSQTELDFRIPRNRRS